MSRSGRFARELNTRRSSPISNKRKPFLSLWPAHTAIEDQLPIEYLQLADKDVPIAFCPKCGDKPFDPFLRGMVQRSVRKWWFFGPPRPYCALICSKCKEIVSYEWP